MKRVLIVVFLVGVLCMASSCFALDEPVRVYVDDEGCVVYSLKGKPEEVMMGGQVLLATKVYLDRNVVCVLYPNKRLGEIKLGLVKIKSLRFEDVTALLILENL
jgi:hypothetical protein